MSPADAVAPAPSRCRCGHTRLEHATPRRPACARRACGCQTYRHDTQEPTP